MEGTERLIVKEFVRQKFDCQMKIDSQLIVDYVEKEDLMFQVSAASRFKKTLTIIRGILQTITENDQFIAIERASHSY